MKKNIFVLLITFMSSTVAYSHVMMLEPCKADEFRTHGSICTPCSTTDKGYVGSDPEECSKCKDANGKPTRSLRSGWCVINDCGEGKFQVSDGSCISCSTAKSLGFTSAEECSKCKDNKGNSIRKMSGGSCILSDCGDGNFHDIWGNCISCYISESVPSRTEECNKCKDENGTTTRKMVATTRKMVEGFCAPLDCENGYFQDVKGSCRLCSKLDGPPIKASVEECSKCKDTNGNLIRELHGDFCGPIPDCKEGEIREDNGLCTPCSFSGSIITSEEECMKCKDANGKITRMMSGTSCVPILNCAVGEFQWGTSCEPCSEDAIYLHTSAEECSRCENRYMGEDGSCRPCSDDTYPQISTEYCSKSNDRYLGSSDGGETYYSYSCSFPYAYETSAEGCAQCKDSNGKPTRKIFEYNGVKFCGLIDCGPDQFRGLHGSCEFCSGQYALPQISTSPEECAKCLKRRYENGKCILK